MYRKAADGSTRAYLGYDDDIYPSPCSNHDDYHDFLTGILSRTGLDVISMIQQPSMS